VIPKTVDSPLSALDVIYGRRSVRAYTPKRLDKATVTALLDAAVQAPTALHREPWLFAVVQDPVRLRRISNRAKGMWPLAPPPGGALEAADVEKRHHQFAMQLADPDFDIFYQATTLIVIGARSTDPFTLGDCWMAAENLMLAATALGLGSCCIGAAVPALNTPDGNLDVGLGPDVTAIAAIVVGEPAGATAAVSRRTPLIVSWKT
jgi:nitroreductase